MAPILLLLLVLACCHVAHGVDDICEQCNCYHQKKKLIIDCSYMDLEIIPPNIPVETFKLYLQGNLLPDLGTTTNLGVKQLPNLKVLYLMNNPIVTVTTAFFAVVPRVHTLMLHHCAITALPNDVFTALTRLKWLWINHNELTAVPQTLLHGLVQLRELYMYNNSLVTIPDGMFRDQEIIKHVYLFNNPIPTTDLSCCQMCGLPEPVDVKWGRIKQDTELKCGYDNDVSCTVAGVSKVCYTSPASGGKGETYKFSAASKNLKLIKGLVLACVTLVLATQQLLL